MLPGPGVLDADSGGLAKLDGFTVAAGEVHHGANEVAAVIFFDGDIERAGELAGTGEVGAQSSSGSAAGSGPPARRRPGR